MLSNKIDIFPLVARINKNRFYFMCFLCATDVLNHIIPVYNSLTLNIKNYFTHVENLFTKFWIFTQVLLSVARWLLLRRFYDSLVSLPWAELAYICLHENNMILSTNSWINGRICTCSSHATNPAQWPPAMREVIDWRRRKKASQHLTGHGQCSKRSHEWNLKRQL